MPMTPTGGYALVTGASGGIGGEIARALAKQGYDLLLSGRAHAPLERLAAELQEGFSVHAEIILCDLACEGGAAKLAAAVRERGCPIEVLVNNAGFGYDAPFAQSDPDRQHDLVATNCMALMELTRQFAGDMQARGHGGILNVASVAGFLPGPRMSTYYASKAFVQSFTLALHAELRGAGVHVTALCPGPTRTEFWNRADAGKTALAHLTLPASIVARTGVVALRANKALCAPGLLAKLIIFASRLMPRTLYGRVASALQYQKQR